MPSIHEAAALMRTALKWNNVCHSTTIIVPFSRPLELMDYIPMKRFFRKKALKGA